MKVIIAGSRTLPESSAIVAEAVESSGFHVSEVVCGMAAGTDRAGLLWAKANGLPVAEFHANWQKYGSSAGPIRNHAMAVHADALLAIWDGRSRGTRNMIETATQMELPVVVFRWDGKRLCPASTSARTPAATP